MVTRRHLRVLGYARVSSEGQARGTSLEDQQASMLAYAKSLGMEVSRFFVEAESSLREKFEHREQMQALLADVRAGDLVLCDKMDRWSRDPEFTYSSVRKILEAKAAFYAVHEGLDPSTKQGDTELGFRILFAREEHKRIKERMVGTRNALRDRGHSCEGKPPLGYRRQAGKGERSHTKNVLVIVPDEAAIVRNVFALCIGGMTLRQIATSLEMEQSGIRRILRRRLYIGEMTDSRGQWIRALHEPIVDVATFELAAKTLTERSVGGARPSPKASATSGWILRDVATCGLCGARMSARYSGSDAARYYAYRCARICTRGTIGVPKIEAIAEPMILARLAELRAMLAEPPQPKRAPKADPAAKRIELQRRRARILDTYADGHIDRDELRVRLAKVDTELLRLAVPAPAEEPVDVSALLATIEGVEAAWASTTRPERREIARMLAVSVGLVKGEGPSFVWRSLADLERRRVGGG